MSPYLFAQAVSVPLGLSDRATDAAESVLVDCLDLEAAALAHELSVTALRQAISAIVRQAYRILAVQLPREEEPAECRPLLPEPPARHSYVYF